MKTCMIGILALVVIQCCAQPQRPCPRFVVDTTIGRAYVDSFKKLYQRCVDTTPVFLKKEAFLSMLRHLSSEAGSPDYTINGFRIFLGQQGNRIRYIFTGLRDANDVGEYFTITKKGNTKQISEEEVETWVQTYAQQTLPCTNRVVGNDTNTLTYLYNRGLIYDILSELSLQKSNRDIIGVNIRLGAYPADFVPYSNRLLVGFSFVRQDSTEVALQKISDINFGCRFDLEERFQKLDSLNYFINSLISEMGKDKSDLSSVSKSRKSRAVAYVQAINGDTGVPCPPGRICGTASIQPTP